MSRTWSIILKKGNIILTVSRKNAIDIDLEGREILEREEEKVLIVD
jgi:hypothetical protein